MRGHCNSGRRKEKQRRMEKRESAAFGERKRWSCKRGPACKQSYCYRESVGANMSVGDPFCGVKTTKERDGETRQGETTTKKSAKEAAKKIRTMIED